MPGNEKAMALTHSVNSGYCSGGGLSKLNNYSWSDSEDIISEEGIKLTEHISKSRLVVVSSPLKSLSEIRDKTALKKKEKEVEEGEVEEEEEDIKYHFPAANNRF